MSLLRKNTPAERSTTKAEAKDGKKFFFNLYASNKVGIATSQMYLSAQSALIGVKSVTANAADAPTEDQSLKNLTLFPIQNGKFT